MAPDEVIVLKYGGALLGDPAGRKEVVREIERAQAPGRSVVAVVSAMGRLGDPYATDTLLSLFDEAHTAAPSATRDLLVSSGETISAALMTHLLICHGLPAVAFTGSAAGIRTDERFGEAAIRGVDPRRLRRALSRGLLPVVAGFQGATKAGDVATLGRGGSDLTAVALGTALGAGVEIVKEVPGIMTCDPALIPGSRLLPYIPYALVYRLAVLGSQVIHARAAAMAWRHRVRLLIRQIGQEEGTEVGDEPLSPALDETPARIVGLASRSGLNVLSVRTWPHAPDRVLGAVTAADVDVDLLVVDKEALTIAVVGDDEAISRALADAGVRVARHARCARISAVGCGALSRGGWFLRGLRALAARGVVVQAASGDEVSLSYLVPERLLTEALEELHAAFALAGRLSSRLDGD